LFCFVFFLYILTLIRLQMHNSIVYHETKHTYTYKQQRLQGLTVFLRQKLWPQQEYAKILSKAKRRQRQRRQNGQDVLTIGSHHPTSRRTWHQKQRQTRWWRRPDGSRYRLRGPTTFDFGTWMDRQVSITVNQFKTSWPPPTSWIKALHPTAQAIINRLTILGTPQQAQLVVGSPVLGVATRIDVVVVDTRGKHWLVELKTYCAFTYHQAVGTMLGGPRSSARQHQVQALMTELLFQATPSEQALHRPGPLCEAVLLLVDARNGQVRFVRLNNNLRQRVKRWINQLQK
jgi:hypothetical protein